MRSILFVFSVILFFSFSGYGSQVKELKQKIILYNLINGIYLDKEQIEFFLKEARKVNAFQGKIKEELEEKEEEEKEILAVLKEEAKKEVFQPPSSLVSRLRRIKVEKAKIYKEFDAFVEEEAEKIKKILRREQVYLLENFKPCLIPPQGPSRIGESSDKKGRLNFLTRVRKMPSETYRIKKEEIIQKFIERYRLFHPHLEEEKIDKLREELEKIMEEARDMEDVEFSLKRNSFVERLKSVERKGKVIKVEKKIKRLLLNPHLIPVLENIYSLKKDK